MKRITAFLLCLALLSAALCSCSAGRPIKGTDRELAVVGTIGGFDVLYEELLCVTQLYRDQLERQYGEGIWDDPTTAEAHRAELEELVGRNITANYAVLSLCAEVQVFHDDKTIEEAVEKYIDELVDELGGRAAYKEALAAQGLTDHFLRFTVAVDYCQNELYYVYTQDLGLIERSEDAIYDIIMSGEFVRTLHVYIQNDEGDDVEANRRAAEDVKAQLDAGADIKQLIGSTVNEDLSLTTTDGYYFTHGEMVSVYEDAAFGLDIGGVSDVIETSGGFYVLQRLELEPQYVLTHLSDLALQYQYAQLNAYIDERQGELSMEYNDYGASLDLTKIS